MKRRIAIIMALLSLLLASCAQPGNEESLPLQDQTIGEITESGKDISLSSETTVTITGLEEGALYGIWPTSPTGRPREATDPSPLIRTNGGTYLLASDGRDFSFQGRDVNIVGDGSVKIVKYENTETDMTINTENDNPHHYIWDYGQRCPVYEEFYRVDLNTIEGLDKSRVAIIMHDSGSGSFSTQYGIIDRIDGNLVDSPGLMNLEGENTIGLFSQVVKRNGNRIQTLSIVSPAVLEAEKVETIKPQGDAFEIKETRENIVLEVDIGQNSISGYHFRSGAIDTQISSGLNAGKRRPNVLPLSYNRDEGKVLLYVGPVEEDFFLVIDTDESITKAGTIKLLNNLNTSGMPHYVDVGKGTAKITVSADDYFAPVIFKSDNPDDLVGLGVKADFSSSDYSGRIIYSHTYGFGYSQAGMNNHDNSHDRVGDLTYDILEHFFIRNDRGEAGTITFSFSKEDFAPDRGKKIPLDASFLKEGLYDEIEAGYNDILIIKNLVPGTLYGVFFNEEVRVRDDRFVDTGNGYYVALATDETLTIDLAGSFEIADTTQIRFNHLSIEDGYTQNTADDTPLFSYEWSDGQEVRNEDVYVKCFRFDNLDGKQALLTVHTGGSGSGGTSPQFINAETGEEIYNEALGTVYDFTGVDSALLVGRVSVSEGSYELEYRLEKPQTVGSEETSFHIPGYFNFLNRGDNELVVEMKFNDGGMPDSHAFSYPIASYPDGTKSHYFFPFSSDEATCTILLYAGVLKDDTEFVIDSNFSSNIKPASIKLRPITEEEKQKIKVLNLTNDNIKETISLEEGPNLIIFSAEKTEQRKGWTISYETESENIFYPTTFEVKTCPENYVSSSSKNLKPGESLSLENDRLLEAILIEANTAGEIILSMTR